ncbi:arylsulfatase L-like isoform X7 [Hyla sarda]|uniref:arylsulfatase L-like isoform X7 n=1 Tax=Hyla sarda TaxID=327740 RepID=UPI0024C29002|nr:arylsulfatase L-like isoform X7 [Hyla sarda]
MRARSHIQQMAQTRHEYRGSSDLPTSTSSSHFFLVNHPDTGGSWTLNTCIYMAILPLLLLVLGVFPVNEATAQKPNILLFLADDLGIGDVGCYGNDTIRTPNIDRLAKEGVKLTHHISAASLCSPSRSAFMTGRYPIRTGMTGHHNGKVLLWNAASGGLPTNETTFAKILKEQGYSTGILVGKIWKFIHIPWKMIVICTLAGSLYFMYWFIAFGFMPYWNCILMRNFEIVEQPMDLDKKATQIVREAKAFINRNKDGPFLLFVSFLHIHTPHYTTKEFRGRSKHDLYGDNIEEMDWMLGQILDSIDQEGLINNTLTYFASDHGGYLEGMIGSLHLKGSNGIYRGGKGMGGMEGGIRVPGILRWPNVLPANAIIDKPTSLMDIFPTVVKLGGGMLPKDRIIDGKDMMPLLQGFVSISAHEFMFHYCEEYLHAVRWQQTRIETVWKVHYISPKFSPEGAGACYGSKFCTCSGEKVIYHVPPLLYNLSNDPSEKNPLSNDSELYREVLQTIQEAVVRHNATLHPVPQQLYGLNNLWDPRLQPCCGTFPFCWCNKETD